MTPPFSNIADRYKTAANTNSGFDHDVFTDTPKQTMMINNVVWVNNDDKQTMVVELMQ